MTRYTIPTTAAELDALNAEIRAAQNKGMNIGLALHHQYKGARKLFGGDTTGTGALRIFKDSAKMTPTEEFHGVDLTTDSMTVAEPITEEMLDTGMAFAGTHVKTVIEKMFNERNNSLSNKELAQAFEKENLSQWEKTMIEGLLIDRHEDENSEEEHDAVLEKDDPIAAIVKKYQS